MKEFVASPRKAKGKNTPRAPDAAGRSHIIRDLSPDSPTTPTTSFRAPQPPRMVPVSVNNGGSSQTGNTKRKAINTSTQTPPGKLPRVSKNAREIPMPMRDLRGDVFAYPKSPLAPQDLDQSSGFFAARRHREGTNDTDMTYMPPPTTAETDVSMGQDEISATETS